MSKALLTMDEEAKASGGERAIDIDFIAQNTSGFYRHYGYRHHLHHYGHHRWHR